MSAAGRKAVPMPAPPEDQISEVPAPPKRLAARGKAVWATLARQLIRQQLLTAGDLFFLEELCVMHDEALALERGLEKTGYTTKMKGSGYESPRPQWSMLSKLREQIRMYHSELGVTPQSRTKLGVKAGKSVSDKMAEARARLRKA